MRGLRIFRSRNGANSDPTTTNVARTVVDTVLRGFVRWTWAELDEIAEVARRLPR